jgi:hypothetical protein
VGAPGYQRAGGPTFHGTVFAFNLDTDGINPTAVISPTDLTSGSNFGGALDIYKNWLAVGAYGHFGYDGRVYVFDISSGYSNTADYATGSSTFMTDSRGMFSVAINQNHLVIGAAYHTTQTGQVYIIPNDGSWNTSKMVTMANQASLATNSQFGYSLALDGNRLFVGSRLETVHLQVKVLLTNLI